MKKKFSKLNLLIVILLTVTFISIKTDKLINITKNLKFLTSNLQENYNEQELEGINEELIEQITLSELPNISAELLKEKTIIKNNEISFEYEIIPQDFNYNLSSNENMDVIVVIQDKYEKENDLIDIKNAIWNKLISELPKEGKTRFSLIVISNTGADTIISLNDYINSSDYYGDLQKKIEGLNKYNNSNSAAKAIYVGLDKAYNELTNYSRVDSSKSIIIISDNKTNYNKFNNDYKILFDKIKFEKYNVVTLSLQNEDKYSDLYNVHKYIGGDDSNILYNNNTNNGVSNNMMELVRKKLISYTNTKAYEFNPIIELNLGENFTAVEGIDNLGRIKISTITYNLTQNNNYSAENQFVKVKLKINTIKPGEYGFGDNSKNVIMYSGLSGRDIIKNVETPKIIIKENIKNLEHGLYEGVKDNSITLYNSLEENKIIISPGSTVTFGAKFITSNDEFELNLNADTNLNKIEISDIKVYKLDKITGSLIEITNSEVIITDLGDNNFSIKASNLNNNAKDTEIVIVYKGRMEENIRNEFFTNYIKFSDLNYAKVRIKSGSFPNSNTEENEKDYQGVLPDLF